MISDERFAKLVAKFIGVPYRLNGRDFDGMDCVSFVYLFEKELGVIFSDTFEQYSMDDYVSIYLVHGRKAKKIFERYVRSWTIPVDIPQRGDVMILKKDDDVDFAVFVGRGNMLFNDYRAGNVVIPIGVTEYDEIEYRRGKIWLEQ